MLVSPLVARQAAKAVPRRVMVSLLRNPSLDRLMWYRRCHHARRFFASVRTSAPASSRITQDSQPSSTSPSWLLASAIALLVGGGALGFTNHTTPLIAEAEPECTHCQKEEDKEEVEDDKWLEQSGLGRVHNASPDVEDEAEEDSLPPYVPKQFKGALDNALDHNRRHLPEDAKEGLATHSMYRTERAQLTLAPEVPPPIDREHPVTLVVDMVCKNKKMNIQGNTKYEYWPFGYYDDLERRYKYGVPGPFIRARAGDVLQVNFTNLDDSGMAHSIDFHSVCGPGGGSPTNFAEQEETKVGAYLLEKPGLYVYHCAAAPIPVHIHNGMFGLILVEPTEGLPPVDREFYIMQHELYLEKDEDDPKTFEMDYDAAAKEIASHVLFNGREGALVEKPCVMKQNETIRIYFGNAGPNLVSSFHVIGTIFDKVYREGDVISDPAKCVQTTLVPAGGACIVDMKLKVPGAYSIVDHSIFRIDKGAVGMIKVKGKPRPDIYDSLEPPKYCPGCKTHQ